MSAIPISEEHRDEGPISVDTAEEARLGEYTRPPQYDFVRLMHDHLQTHLDKYPDQYDEGITPEDIVSQFLFAPPRQFEIHLPWTSDEPMSADHVCNFSCVSCAGSFNGPETRRESRSGWEDTMLDHIRELNGFVPYSIFGGNYTEPLNNRRLTDFLEVTKESGGHFGVHTNGYDFQSHEKGLRRVMGRRDVDSTDYISTSIYGGTPKSFGRFAGIRDDQEAAAILQGVFDGARMLGRTKKDMGSDVALRFSYLINGTNRSPKDIYPILDLANEVGVDSIRFSIAFAPYGFEMDNLPKYHERELAMEDELVGDSGWLPDAIAEYPNLNAFFRPVAWQRPELFQEIERCYYGYYQITIGADGRLYRCSTTTTSPHHSFGDLSHETSELLKVMRQNQDPEFDAHAGCELRNQRCNQMGADVNGLYNRGYRI